MSNESKKRGVMEISRFEDLIAWQKARTFQTDIYYVQKRAFLQRFWFVLSNSKCKEQKKFKVAAYLYRCEFELFVATQQLVDFQHADKIFRVGYVFPLLKRAMFFWINILTGYVIIKKAMDAMGHSSLRPERIF
jgi:hypothetical protein